MRYVLKFTFNVVGMTNTNLESKHDVSLISPANFPYKNILDAISECAAVLSSNGEFVYTNSAFSAIFKQSSEHPIIGKQLFDIFPDIHLESLLSLLSNGKFKTVSYDLDFIHKNLQTYQIRLTLYPILFDEVFMGYVALILNVNEHNKTHQLLENERYRLTQAQRVAKIGSWETELATMSVQWSEETHRIFETDSNTFNPSHSAFLNLVHPDDRNNVDNAFVSSLSSISDHTLEHRLLMADGRVKFVEEHWRVYFDPDGEPLRVFGTCQDVSERKSSEKRIQYLAFYDSLTNLPNRQLLLDRLNTIHSSSANNPNYAAVLFIDLDNFKGLNDTQGHDIGDLLLIETAKRLKLCVRNSDTVGRLGGDEFIVIVQDLDVDINNAATDAEKLGNLILSAISEPYTLNDQSYYGTTSIGICLFSNKEISVNELLKRADTAMYQAKNAGRNTLRFYEPEMQAALESRSLLEAELRTAVTQKQFHLYYQMQVDHHKKILGAEALIRWDHPKIGFVSPMQFIPLAETSGLILPIGHWVLKTACAQIKAWEKNPLTKDLKISINVSARQFLQVDFVDQVIKAVESNEIDPNKLKLELTETVVLSNIDETILKMNALKDFGIAFSLDDFGTGYSSLSYLTKLPLDELKIDQSFVRNIFTNQKAAVIVQTIIGMATNLGMEVIAEGVETELQKAFLEKHGCKLFQGYLFGKPVPIKDFEKIV